MTSWITSNPSVDMQKWLPQELKSIELACPQALAHRLKKDYLQLWSEQDRLQQLNRILLRKGRYPIRVPVYHWTNQHAISLTAKLMPLVLGVTVVGLLPTGELLIETEGSPEWVGIRVSCSPDPTAHLIVNQPPRFSHRLPLLVALTQLLHHPAQPEVHTALLLRQRLSKIYPSGSLVRDLQMQKLFSPAQIQALLQLHLIAKLGRAYRI